MSLTGSEHTRHVLSMAGRQLKMMLIAGLVVGIGVMALILSLAASPGELNAAKTGLFAASQAERLKAKRSLEWAQFFLRMKQSAPFGLLAAVAAAGGVFWVFSTVGRKSKIEKYRRGARIITSDQLGREVSRRAKKLGMETEFTLAGVPVPPGAERQMIAVLGATGVGKSTLIRGLLDQIRVRGEKALIYDPGGHYFSVYGQKGDWLLNPYDRRADDWSIFNEVKTKSDCLTLASSLVPESKDAGGEFWSNGARNLLSGVLQRLHETNQATLANLRDWMLYGSTEELKKLLAGTVAASALGSGEGEQAGGIHAHATQQLRWLEHLAEREPHFKEPFSLRDWIRNGSGFTFITVPKDRKPELKPLLSLWFDMAARELMTMGDANNHRRIWIIIDEFADLHQLQSMGDLLSQGRKYGAAALLGFQNFAQLQKIYGREGAVALLDCCNSRFIFRVNDPESAKWAQDSMGEREVTRRNQSDNAGRNQGVSLGEQVSREPLVMASEFQELPDLKGYLKLSGDYPKALVTVPAHRPQIRWKEFREWTC